MDVQSIIQLWEACLSREYGGCNGCNKARECKEFQRIIKSVKEPWEINRLIEDIADYKDENLGE